MLIAGGIGVTAQEDLAPPSPAPEMESIELPEELGAASSGEEVKTQTWWLFNKLPYSWWPSTFCKWDYYTTAAWQITVSGNGVSCTDATGKATGAALAKLARQAVTTSPRVKAMFRFGRIGQVATNAALCARIGSKTLKFTVRLSATKSMLDVLRRTTSSKTVLKNLINSNNARSTLRTAGAKNWVWVSTDWINTIWCGSGCPNEPTTLIDSVDPFGPGFYDCVTPLQPGASCSYSCDAGVPLADSDPICVQGETYRTPTNGNSPQCVECNVVGDCTDPTATDCTDNVCVIPAVTECTTPPADPTGGGGTYTCTIPAAVDATCDFTCTDPTTAPDPATVPTCGADGNWANGTGGPPACV